MSTTDRNAYSNQLRLRMGYIPSMYIQPRLRYRDSLARSEQHSANGTKHPKIPFVFPPADFDALAYKQAERDRRRSLLSLYCD